MRHKVHIISLLITLMICTYAHAGVDFDGVDDYLDMTTSSAYQLPNTSFTVTGYFKSNADDGYIFAKRIITGGNGGYFLRIDAAGTLTARIYDTNGNPTVSVSTSATTLKDGIRHCFAIVFTTDTTTASSNQVTIYVDGAQDGLQSGSGNPYVAIGNKFVAGTVSDLDPTGWLNGGIDDLRIWSTAFTAAQALRYCSAKVHHLSMGLPTLSYWPLDSCGEGASAGGVVFSDVAKGGVAATGVIGGNGTGLTCHGSASINYVGSVE